ncbi:adenosylcobalamin/alpha-ribazole phosphatase [Xenorhabdus bovienii]|uniref:adenosylcobalamin/alpha-ribazole phosphatase n=1 Tax=Xenorhabdus bovienii TaxID=40576 RepID=UPI0023B2EEAC|nr:adenosylcobalamin/alpha-ribazole phosphatase [Xenorhabdus bovienii]MDE9492371.1 adenosylcobalamin/alpha-ribazole phosphatase [Xenorhabdus bovienii]MDE9500898.1 adenosylcobalamin/alpha-ribazole phosphatase [Xenorhabdus bovienii]MDE9518426.1 adenosylcobalamin/alpha-ribazole phosphatase [Xenorhabdus bovienii]MDE9524564.1 adenosylcobalamin/alpha-ribazole phosphatase [Xenorhabdus bovienii]MDE9567855.1 adenosylcobalamin/alpha-ribazole phosphatase [Xenorhabdus bovienii]
MRLFLVRHGQTEANINGVFCGSTDLPLTEAGIKQAQQVAAALKHVDFQSVHGSEMQRSQHTAHIISPFVIELEHRLNELNFGAWELCHHEMIAKDDPQAWARWLSDWQNACPTGGEAFRDFAARVGSYVDEVRSATAEGNQLIVAHQGVLALLLTRLLNLPTEAMWSFPFQQGAYSVVDNHTGFITLRIFNGRAEYRPEE